jgi:hypothetical protein
MHLCHARTLHQIIGSSHRTVARQRTQVADQSVLFQFEELRERNLKV